MQNENGTWDINAFTDMLSNPSYGEEFFNFVSQFQEGKEAIGEFLRTGDIATETMDRLNTAIGIKGASNMRKWGQETDKVVGYMEGLNGTAEQVADTWKQMNTTIKNASNNQYFRRSWANGGRDGKTLEAIANMTGYSKEEVKSGKFNDDINRQLELSESADIAGVQSVATSVFDSLETNLNQYVASNPLTIDGLQIGVDSGTVNVDLSQAEAQLGSVLTKDQQQMIAMLQKWGVQAHIEITGEGENVTAQIVIDSLGSGYKPGGNGGGGGGGKSAAQKLIDRLKRMKEITDHRLKMLQYTESFYEGRGEITNSNLLLEQENTLRGQMIEEYQGNIEKLTNQMKTTKKESDDWYALREAILSYEEGIEECNNAIDENIRKMDENEHKIRELRIGLENQLHQEFENREKLQRSMLEGTVQMQDTILNAIRERYQEEWDLIKRDIDKKKEALEEEKNLISERLNKRKEAEDEAEKYEELMELRRQLALVSMDSTRTKDAAELREKIADIEKDLAWKSAEEEAEAQQDTLQDQIDAYDQFTENGDEDLDALLENANNFATEVNSVLYLNQKDLFDWLKENVKEYANSLDEAQQNMVYQWTDTFEQMWNIVHRWWDEINNILMSEDTFIAFMRESQDYIHASETDQRDMLWSWSQAYNDMVNSMKTGAHWEHDDEFNFGTSGKK